MHKATKTALALTMAMALGLAALPALAGTSVPETAVNIASRLDAQLVERLQLVEGPAKGTTLILTTPVDQANLEASSPLARLLAEELAMWFVENGYRVQEIRKTKNILLDPGTGELSLSRDVRFVDNRYQKSAVTLTATYTQTSRNVRFNVRLLHAPTGEVLAMAAGTIAVTAETAELLDATARAEAARVRPSVNTAFSTRGAAQAVGMSQWSVPNFAPSMGTKNKGPLILDYTE